MECIPLPSILCKEIWSAGSSCASHGGPHCRFSSAGSVWHSQFLILSKERNLKKKKKNELSRKIAYFGVHSGIYSLTLCPLRTQVGQEQPVGGEEGGSRGILYDQEWSVVVKPPLAVILIFATTSATSLEAL